MNGIFIVGILGVISPSSIFSFRLSPFLSFSKFELLYGPKLILCILVWDLFVCDSGVLFSAECLCLNAEEWGEGPCDFWSDCLRDSEDWPLGIPTKLT